MTELERVSGRIATTATSREKLENFTMNPCHTTGCVLSVTRRYQLSDGLPEGIQKVSLTPEAAAQIPSIEDYGHRTDYIVFVELPSGAIFFEAYTDSRRSESQSQQAPNQGSDEDVAPFKALINRTAADMRDTSTLVGQDVAVVRDEQEWQVVEHKPDISPSPAFDWQPIGLAIGSVCFFVSAGIVAGSGIVNSLLLAILFATLGLLSIWGAYTLARVKIGLPSAVDLFWFRWKLAQTNRQVHPSSPITTVRSPELCDVTVEESPTWTLSNSALLCLGVSPNSDQSFLIPVVLAGKQPQHTAAYQLYTDVFAGRNVSEVQTQHIPVESPPTSHNKGQDHRSEIDGTTSVAVFNPTNEGSRLQPPTEYRYFMRVYQKIVAGVGMGLPIRLPRIPPTI